MALIVSSEEVWTSLVMYIPNRLVSWSALL